MVALDPRVLAAAVTVLLPVELLFWAELEEEIKPLLLIVELEELEPDISLLLEDELTLVVVEIELVVEPLD